MTKPQRKPARHAAIPSAAQPKRRDVDALVNAGVWLIHLNPKRVKARGKSDVVGLLLASRELPVRAVIGKAGGKRLSNLLVHNRRRAVLVPSWPVLAGAIAWAWKVGLPVIPMKQICEIAPEVGVFPRTFHRFQSFERDVWTLAFAVSQQEVTLPHNAQKALERIVLRLLRRLAQLADDD
jgi:hypothetical protein